MTRVAAFHIALIALAEKRKTLFGCWLEEFRAESKEGMAFWATKIQDLNDAYLYLINAG